MSDRLARLSRTETNVVRPEAPVITVVDAHRLAPAWLIRRVARAWFTLDPGTPRLIDARPLPSGRTEWRIAWTRQTGSSNG